MKFQREKLNKRGWLMIVESVIAVMILFGFVFIAMAKQAQETKALREKPNFYDIANMLVEYAQKNESVRNAILAGSSGAVNESLKIELVKINPGLSLDVAINTTDSICNLNLPEKEIYGASAIIASNSSNYDPKKLCVFVWKN